MRGILDEALGINEPRKSLDDGDEPVYLENPMVAVEPSEHKLPTVQPVPATDTWADYEYSRDVAQKNLKQAQIVLESAVSFVNSSPSARSFEVLGNLIKTVNDCGATLLDLQKKMRDLAIKESTPNPDDKGGDTNIYVVGDPTDILDKIDGLRKERDIEGTSERTS
jgi:hypothetical protein